MLHELPVGPPALPLAHVPVVSHHPQPLVAVHVPQLVAVAHGSDDGHALAYHAQSLPLHAPPYGPVELPRSHVPVFPHQPHGYVPVQLPQSVNAEQSVPHAEPSVLQFTQLPLSGPLESPGTHAPVAPSAHHPQPLRPVQSPQSLAPAHGSPEPGHSPGSQLHPPQLPLSGPLELPS